MQIKLFPQLYIYIYISVLCEVISTSSAVEAFERLQMFLIYLALQLLWDAVREFVVFFNPLPPVCVFYSHGCYT